MVYNPKGFTDNSPRYIIKPTPVKKPSAIKLPCLFINLLLRLSLKIGGCTTCG